MNLDGKDLPTIEVSFEKEINKFSCCYELMHIRLAMYSFLLCSKLTQEFFTNLEAEKINDTEKLMLPHGTRIFLSRSLANNSDRADVIRKDLLNAAKLIYATKQRLINKWQVPTCGDRKFYIPTDISELDRFVFVANVSQEQAHNNEPASQEQITSSINKINTERLSTGNKTSESLVVGAKLNNNSESGDSKLTQSIKRKKFETRTSDVPDCSTTKKRTKTSKSHKTSMEMNQSSKANLSDNKLSAKVEYATWIKGDDKIYNVDFAQGSKTNSFTKKKFKVDITYVHNNEQKSISNKEYESGKETFL